MSYKELKKMVLNAVRALKGKPEIEPLAIPLLKVERQPIKTVRAHYEISRREFELAGRDIATKYVKPRLLGALVDNLNNSGLVQVRIERKDYESVVFHASIKVVEQTREE